MLPSGISLYIKKLLTCMKIFKNTSHYLYKKPGEAHDTADKGSKSSYCKSWRNAIWTILTAARRAPKNSYNRHNISRLHYSYAHNNFLHVSSYQWWSVSINTATFSAHGTMTIRGIHFFYQKNSNMKVIRPQSTCVCPQSWSRKENGEQDS